MEGEALKPALAATRLDVELRVWGGEVEIPGDGLPVVADRVQQAAHVVDEQAARPRLIDEEHHARRLLVDVRE